MLYLKIFFPPRKASFPCDREYYREKGSIERFARSFSIILNESMRKRYYNCMVGWTRVNSFKNLLFDEIARYLSKRFNAENLWIIH